MQKYHSKHENIAKQTQFRTWKKGKSWLYAASILTVLTGGAAASSVVTPDSVTASADTVTPAAYRPAGEATGPGSVVSSEVAANASSYYAAASSALSGTDSDGVHSSGASDIVSSANDKAATRTATSVQALAHSRQALLVSHQARLMTGIMLLQVLYQQLRRILRRIVFRALSATIRMPLIRRTVTMLPITSRHQAVPTLSMRQLTATVQAIPTQAMRLVSISPLLTATAQQFTTTIILL